MLIVALGLLLARIRGSHLFQLTYVRLLNDYLSTIWPFNSIQRHG